MEGRPLVKENASEIAMCRTQSRASMIATLERIREYVQREPSNKLTALYHHVYQIENLRTAYWQVKRHVAAGIDGQTRKQYGQELETNLAELSERLRKGAYQATPVRRVYIPKADGRQRPLGVTAFEDKLVQYVTAKMFSSIWEEEFLGFSYGFRPRRSAHDALDALAVGIGRKGVKWVLDADIKGFYDTISHEWMVKFLEHRIGDKRIIRLVKKWLEAGVMEDGEWQASEEGTPQGGLISPVLANIYLHYVLDQWVQQWRKRQARGTVIIVRYADDFVIGFGNEKDAERFKQELKDRLQKFNLELQAEKTRLIEFGRYAERSRTEQGLGKPETFNFLGFTHISTQNKHNMYVVLRQTMRKRMQTKLKEITRELKHKMHEPIPEQGQWLKQVLQGHYQYYGVPLNSRQMSNFRHQVVLIWKRTISKRSQKGEVTWERMLRLITRWIPAPRICHPYPGQRITVTI
jgi:group II intron reverse transcriptase/maturase